MSIIVYNEVAEPIIPAGDLAGPVRDALGTALRSMRYVSSDFAGLYQDATGTTPVTAVGQPVGLMLDRRFGLERGVERVTNGDFTSGTTGWTSAGAGVTIASVAGRLRLETPFANGYATQTVPTVAGRAYEISFVWWGTNNTITNTLAAFGAAASPSLSATSPAPGTRIRFIAYAVAASTRLDLRISGGAEYWAEYASISVRELPGNHASQATTTARPTLRSGPLRIDYDGVDDYLRTVFPDLGSDVTIARSIPGVGAQILTGQTIAAGDWDDNVDSCATLVIDRALTGPEAALVTAFLNQQAGV